MHPTRPPGGAASSRPSWQAAPRPDRERGAAAVEFALVVPLLLVLIFGMVDFGLSIADTQAVRSGTSAAARRAVVGDFGTDSSCTLAGLSTTVETHELICSIKTAVNLSNVETRVKVLIPTPYETGESMVLCTQYPVTSATGFFSTWLDGKTLTSRLEVRVDVANPTAPVSAAETSVNGDAWSWCMS